MKSKEKLRKAIAAELGELLEVEDDDPDKKGGEVGAAMKKELEAYRKLGEPDSLKARIDLLQTLGSDQKIRPIIDKYLAGDQATVDAINQALSGDAVDKTGNADLDKLAKRLANLEQRQSTGTPDYNAGNRLLSLELKSSFDELRADPILGAVYDHERDRSDTEEMMRSRALTASEAFQIIRAKEIRTEVAAAAKDAGGKSPGGDLVGSGSRRRARRPEPGEKESKKLASARKAWRESQDEGALRECIVYAAGGEAKVLRDLEEEE